VVTVPLQIKSFVSIFLQEPHRIHYYYGQLLRDYSEGKTKKIFAEHHSPFPYYLSSWLVVCMFRAMRRIPEIPQIWRYHLVLLVRILEGGFFGAGGLADRNYSESYSKSLMKRLESEDLQSRALHRAWSVINNALQDEKLKGYAATRSAAFTETLIKNAQRLLASQTKGKSAPPAAIKYDGNFVGVISAVVTEQQFGYIKYGQQSFRFDFSAEGAFSDADIGKKVRFRLESKPQTTDAVGVEKLSLEK